MFINSSFSPAHAVFSPADNSNNPVYSRLDDTDSLSPIVTDDGLLIGDQYMCADDNVSSPRALGFSTALGDYISVSPNGFIAIGDEGMTSRTELGTFVSDLDSSTNSDNCDSSLLVENFVIYGQAIIDGENSFVTTWYKVNSYSDPNPVGTFQIIIQDTGNNQLKIIRNYESILRAPNDWWFAGFVYGLDVNWLSTDTSRSLLELEDGNGDYSLSSNSLNSDTPGRYITTTTFHSVSYSGGSDATGSPPSQPPQAVGRSFGTASNTFTRSGFTFAGWSDGNSTYAEGNNYVMGDSDVTLTATWYQSQGTSNCNNLAGNLRDPNSITTLSSNNNILNSDFEYGVSGYGKWNFGSGPVDVPWNFKDGYSDSKYEWMTSDETHQIEIWHVEKNVAGQSDFKNADDISQNLGMEPYSGKNWAELGAYTEGVLYQDVATVPGSTFIYTFAHHARATTDHNDRDTMRLSIGAKSSNVQVPPNGIFGTSTNALVLQGLVPQIPLEKALRQNNSDTLGEGAFSRYTGGSDLSDFVGNKWGVYLGIYQVPAGQTCTRFAFSYVTGAGPSTGNFLDGVKFSRALDDEFENYTTSQELNLLRNDNNLTGITDLLDNNLQPLDMSPSSPTEYVTSLGGFVSITSANTVHYRRPTGINSGVDIFSYEAQDDLGNRYTASVVINIHPLTLSGAGVGVYLDMPFVQGSYATVYAGTNENFNHSQTSCPTELSIGTLTGTCLILNNLSFASTTEVSSQIVGGTSNPYASGQFSISFSTPQRYVGFWWSAGNEGNRVTYFSNGIAVASYDVGQVLSNLGPPPPSESYATWPLRVTAINGNTYESKYYFGNPSGYSSLTPTSLSSRTAAEPFSYIHAFAQNGLTFDKIEFSGPGFEIDNISVSAADVTIDPRLVQVLSVESTSSLTSRTISFETTSYNLQLNDTQIVHATASAGTGTITYNAGTSTACIVNSSSGLVTITESSGTCQINASIAGDPNYYGATTTTPVSITINGSPPPPPPPPVSGSLSWSIGGKATKIFSTQNTLTLTRTFSAEIDVSNQGKAYLLRATLNKSGVCGTFTPTIYFTSSTSLTLNISDGASPTSSSNLVRGSCYQWTQDTSTVESALPPIATQTIDTNTVDVQFTQESLTSNVLALPKAISTHWPSTLPVDPRASYVDLPIVAPPIGASQIHFCVMTGTESDWSNTLYRTNSKLGDLTEGYGSGIGTIYSSSTKLTFSLISSGLARTSDSTFSINVSENDFTESVTKVRITTTATNRFADLSYILIRTVPSFVSTYGIESSCTGGKAADVVQPLPGEAAVIQILPYDLKQTIRRAPISQSKRR